VGAGVISIILGAITSLVGFRPTKLAGCEISGLMIWINPENNQADWQSHVGKILNTPVIVFVYVKRFSPTQLLCTINVVLNKGETGSWRHRFATWAPPHKKQHDRIPSSVAKWWKMNYWLKWPNPQKLPVGCRTLFSDGVFRNRYTDFLYFIRLCRGVDSGSDTDTYQWCDGLILVSVSVFSLY